MRMRTGLAFELRVVNEHSESVFNEALPSAGIFRTEPRAPLRRLPQEVRRARRLPVILRGSRPSRTLTSGSDTPTMQRMSDEVMTFG
jgi:hypothetical protein